MEENTRKLVLPFKEQLLLERIIREKGLCVEDACAYLYASDFYRKLSTSDLLWTYSPLELYDLLLQEKEQKPGSSPELLLFLAFCLENYREQKRLSADEALLIFNRHKVFGYLFDVYDTLHTQGKDYILDRLQTYINNHPPK